MNMIELPRFDTGQYEGACFIMEGGDAHLVIRISEVGEAEFTFRRTRWHEFTSLHSCEASVIRSAYLRLIEVPDSVRVRSIVSADAGRPAAYRELHHFRIFLDETGCHEVVAESASLEVRPAR